MVYRGWSGLVLAALLFAGCNNAPAPDAGANEAVSEAQQERPVFSLAWSEYPSWSVFGVADENGIIDKDKGEMGPIEEKWGVDIVLEQKDYEPCITLFASSVVDAVCITNMDILQPSLGRASVAILPTSTSDGADACIVTEGVNLDSLAGKASYGLEKSVSQYMFERNLEELGKSVEDYPFKSMDPGAAAQAMQTGQDEINSIVVWNPFVLQTLRTTPGTSVLFDSTTIPEEIIDMVVVGKDVLARPGGDQFAHAVVETFYEVNKLMADPEKGDDALVALGEKFSSLGLEDMKIVVEQTKFYKTPEAATELFMSEQFRSGTMPKVVAFCVAQEIVDAEPKVGFEDTSAQLNFTTQFLRAE
ncbi:MAG: hypothetical protein AAGF97_04900 [Planctomycetota bacterium]